MPWRITRGKHAPGRTSQSTAPEAAQYLGISASTLSKLRVFGGGPKFHKLGRRVVYDIRDLDGWFETRQRSSTEVAPIV